MILSRLAGANLSGSNLQWEGPKGGVMMQNNPDMTRNQINDTFLFQNRVKVKVVGEVSEK